MPLPLCAFLVYSNFATQTFFEGKDNVQIVDYPDMLHQPHHEVGGEHVIKGYLDWIKVVLVKNVK